MKNTLLGITVLLLGTAAHLGLAPTANAEEIVCQKNLGAITVDNVKVPQGKTCTLNGTKVQGSVVVENNATLRANAARINGNIQAEGANFVDVVSNSTVGGSIQVVQGKRARVLGSRITGSIQFESNTGALVANNNQVGADIQVFQNTGGVTLRSNRVNGNLQCKENRPAPQGGGNIVNGNKEDQCRSL